MSNNEVYEHAKLLYQHHLPAKAVSQILEIPYFRAAEMLRNFKRDPTIVKLPPGQVLKHIKAALRR